MLGWVRKKAKLSKINDSLVSAFNRIRSDLHSQREVLDELYDNHYNLKHSSQVNNQRIIEWITHFDKSIKSLEKDVSSLEHHIKNKFDLVTEKSLELFKEAYGKNIKDIDAVKAEILSEVKALMAKSEQKSNDAEVFGRKSVKIPVETSFETLSNPEKWMVGLLFNAENPLSYSQIADKTGKTVNTVRVYMNQLKNKGFIDESSLPNGTKLFALRHKAKVKKLYNF